MGNLKNKFSIILPLKNGGEYARSCVNSILAQTCRDFSLIILDNCSSDDNLNWLRNLKDNRIIIHTSARPMKIEENWSRIKSVGKNEFMTIIGHDDLLYPNYLQTMDALITADQVATLYQAHFDYIDEAGQLLRPCQPMAEKLFADEFLDCQMNRSLDSTGTGYMMRSYDYDKLGGISPLYPNLIFADYELWMKLIGKGHFAISRETTFAYRVHDSVSRLTNGEEYQQAFSRYLGYLEGLRIASDDIALTLDRSGKKMLMYFCESLSHRLLKTPKKMRTTTVWNFIRGCRKHARLLIPGQPFRPLLKLRIKAAWLLDNPIGRPLFRLFKKVASAKRV